MAEAREAKAALRKTMKVKLKTLPPDAVAAQSENAASTIFGLKQYREAVNLSVYLSMPGSELQTSSIVTRALEEGKGVFVPHISKEHGLMEMLRLRDVHDFSSLTSDNWGIPTLPKDGLSDRERGAGKLDLILMPAVAFDGQLRRLGHGKGYYDRYLEQYQGEIMGQMPFLVGLALDEQILAAGETIPTNDNDWLVDAVVKGDGSIIHSRR